MPSFDDINRLYQQYLGRDATQDEYTGWTSGQYGATDLAGIESQIAGSGEAQGRRSGGSSGGGGGISYDQINNLYNQYLGRPATQDEYNNWMSGAYGATDLGGITSQIQGSGEAQDYRARQGGGDGGGGGGGNVYRPYDTTGTGTVTAGGRQIPSNPLGPWTPSFRAPANQPLPDVPTFTAPAYTPPPAFNYDSGHPAPTYTPPPAFSYGDFVGPTAEQALQDPGYQFRLSQGTQALQNAASARGTLNDSGTLKALMDYGQGAASQEYANTWQRAADTYNTNRGNALGIYNTNYQTQYTDPYKFATAAWQTGHDTALTDYQTNVKNQYADPYAYAYQAAKDQYAPLLAGWQTNAANVQHTNDVTNTNAWNDYLLGFQDFQNRRGLGVNFALSS